MEFKTGITSIWAHDFICNLSDIYEFAMGPSTNFHGLSYTGLISKGSFELDTPRNSKFSAIICIKAVQERQYQLIWNYCINQSLFCLGSLTIFHVKEYRHFSISKNIMKFSITIVSLATVINNVFGFESQNIYKKDKLIVEAANIYKECINISNKGGITHFLSPILYYHFSSIKECQNEDKNILTYLAYYCTEDENNKYYPLSIQKAKMKIFLYLKEKKFTSLENLKLYDQKNSTDNNLQHDIDYCIDHLRVIVVWALKKLTNYIFIKNMKQLTEEKLETYYILSST
ncbi:hypothetical protein H8356DRAFT_1327911 [Neocallimastix lanati (nom. inval.)]|nr:hypothetical protein H8356DRAFT_1327911 [Neocallimastix sp. JGI-2020a]